jgi:hypothetical protein
MAELSKYVVLSNIDTDNKLPQPISNKTRHSSAKSGCICGLSSVIIFAIYYMCQIVVSSICIQHGGVCEIHQLNTNINLCIGSLCVSIVIWILMMFVIVSGVVGYLQKKSRFLSGHTNCSEHIVLNILILLVFADRVMFVVTVISLYDSLSVCFLGVILLALNIFIPTLTIIVLILSVIVGVFLCK